MSTPGLDRTFDPPDAALLHLMSRLQGASALAEYSIIDQPPEPGEERDAIFVYRYAGAAASQKVNRVGVESPRGETWAVAVLIPEKGDEQRAIAAMSQVRVALVGSGGRNASGCVLSCDRERSEREREADKSGKRWIRRYDLFRLVVGP